MEPEVKRGRYDSTSLGVEQLAAAYISELTATVAELRKPKSKQYSIGLLNRVQRRRAASHDIRRIPRRLREVFKQTIYNNVDFEAEKKKRKSRKSKRRHQSVAFDARSVKAGWLETHVWHAKRFKLESRWGWRVPIRSAEKCHRALYHATQRGAVLQDVSYQDTIHISADTLEVMLNYLADMLPAGQDRILRNKAYLSGSHFAKAWLYKAGQYPRGALAPVQLVFCYDTVTGKIEVIVLCHASHSLLASLPARDGITIAAVSPAVSRFRLFGPQSLRALLAVLSPSSSCGEEEKRDLLLIQDNPTLVRLGKKQMISLHVDDPRLRLHRSKSDLMRSASCDAVLLHEQVPQLQSRCAGGFFSDEDRGSSVDTKFSNSAVDKLRAAATPGGSPLSSDASVSVLLIRDGDCVDLLIPKGWGMSFWIGLIYAGVKVAGLDESRLFEIAAGSGGDLQLACDTTAGAEELSREFDGEKKKHGRRPPAKRVNFSRLGVSFPWQLPLRQLVLHWSASLSLAQGVENSSSAAAVDYALNMDVDAAETVSQPPSSQPEDFFILRDLSQLQLLAKHCSSGARLTSRQLEELRLTLKQAVVTVRLVALRGCLSPWSLLCLPNKEDIPPRPRHMSDTPGSAPSADPVEPLHYSQSSDDMWTLREHSRQVAGFVVTPDYRLPRGRSLALGHVSLLALLQLPPRGLMLFRQPQNRQFRWTEVEVLTTM